MSVCGVCALLVRVLMSMLVLAGVVVQNCAVGPLGAPDMKTTAVSPTWPTLKRVLLFFTHYSPSSEAPINHSGA